MNNPVKIYLRERPMLLPELASPKRDMNSQAINKKLSNNQVIFLLFISRF